MMPLFSYFHINYLEHQEQIMQDHSLYFPGSPSSTRVAPGTRNWHWHILPSTLKMQYLLLWTKFLYFTHQFSQWICQTGDAMPYLVETERITGPRETSYFHNAKSLVSGWTKLQFPTCWLLWLLRGIVRHAQLHVQQCELLNPTLLQLSSL